MMKFGWKRDLPDERDYKYSLHPEYFFRKPLPSKIDLREKLSPVEDQGSLGSCVAQATCGALEFLELDVIENNLAGPESFGSQFQDISRLFIYYNARVLDGTIDEDAGTQLRSAVMAIRKQGICRELLWPYAPSKVFCKPTVEAYGEAEAHKVLSGYRLDNSRIYDLKQCLAHGYPFIFGSTLYESFMDQDTARTGVVSLPIQEESVVGGHAMCCVGYQDSAEAFIVRNSWGSKWGDKGYCYIPYAYLTNVNLSSDFWTLRLETQSIGENVWF